MATRRTQAPPPNPATPLLVLAVGSIASVAAAIYFLPWSVVTFAAVLVAAYMAPMPELTGRKDASGRPTAADPGQERALQSFGVWRALRSTLIAPGAHWFPGTNLRVSWMYGVAVALVAYAWPVRVEVATAAPWAPFAAALSAFLTVLGVDAAHRTARYAYDPCRGVGVVDVMHLSGRWIRVGAACLVAAVAAVGGIIAAGMLALPVAASQVVPVTVGVLGVALGVATAVLHLPARTEVLEPWRDTVATRQAWATRWAQSKTFAQTAPVLVSHERVGPMAVDHFEIPVVLGDASSFVLNQQRPMAALVGAGTVAVVLHVPTIDANTGNPIPGTTHPTRVKVVTWIDGDLPAVDAPDTSPEVAALMIECAVTRAIDAFNPAWHRPVWVGAELVSDTDAEQTGPQVWAAQLALTPTSVNWRHLGRELFGNLQQFLGTTVVVARRSPERLFVGPVDSAALSPDLPRPAAYESRSPERYLDDLREEVAWDVRWGAVKGVGGNIPTPQFVVRQTGSLVDGTEVHFVPFMCRDGFPPDVLGLFSPGAESQMRAGIGSAPFVSIQAYPSAAARTPSGERHPQAVVVVHSTKPVPVSPAGLSPSRGVTKEPAQSSAPYWVLRAMFDRAFDAAKLPRPEVVEATGLTKPSSSQRHVWKVRVRLYGTTLDAVRAKESVIASTLSVPWLRFGPDDAEGFLVVYVGNPVRAEFTDERTEQLIASLDWEQAWVDAGVLGTNGRTPRLLSHTTLDKNPDVSVDQFELPAPVSVESIRARLAKVRSATGKMYVDVVEGDKSTIARITSCPHDPMPNSAQLDWDVVDTEAAGRSLALPFATGVDGEPVAWDIRSTPHLMVVGATGSGKSVLMQNLGVGAVAHGWDLYVVDPSKEAADFRFLDGFARAIATTVEQSAQVLDHVLAEATRRKAVNGAHGVGNYRDLPEELRPATMLVMIDEFTSLIVPDSVSSKPSDNLEVERAREATQRTNEYRARIAAAVARLAREARSVGIALVLGTQKLAAKDLENLPGASTLKVNLGRLILGSTTFGDLQSALRQPERAPALGNVIPQGRGVYEPASSGPVLIQAWWDPQGTEHTRSELESRRTPLVEAERLEFTSVEDAIVAGEVEDLGEVDLDWSDVDLKVVVADDVEEVQPPAGAHDEELSPARLVAVDPGPRMIVALGDDASADADEEAVVVDVSGADDVHERIRLVLTAVNANPEIPYLVWRDSTLQRVDEAFDMLWSEMASEALSHTGIDFDLDPVASVDTDDGDEAPAPPSDLLPVAQSAKPKRPPAVAGLWDEAADEF